MQQDRTNRRTCPYCGAELPEEASFTATLDTVSGQWQCQLPATQQGDRYVCGTGEGTYRFSTTSGDVTIQALS